jgi:hypothetical protein
VEDAKLAYYSSHGNILRESLDHIQIALIIIHGAGRNADDYLCSATAAVKLQKQYPAQSILIIVPHFPSVTDDPITLYEGGIPLKWGDDNEWRYGAQAIYPRYANNFSSFDTVDRIMHVLHNQTNLDYFLHQGDSLTWAQQEVTRLQGANIDGIHFMPMSNTADSISLLTNPTMT